MPADLEASLSLLLFLPLPSPLLAPLFLFSFNDYTQWFILYSLELAGPFIVS